MKKVLIVDDSLVSRMMIEEVIKHHFPEWMFHQAASSEKALALCEKEKFDFITIDLNMPSVSGLEAIPALQACHDGVVKVALVTTNLDPDIKSQVQAFGAHYINKPINENELINFVSPK